MMMYSYCYISIAEIYHCDGVCILSYTLLTPANRDSWVLTSCMCCVHAAYTYRRVISLYCDVDRVCTVCTSCLNTSQRYCPVNAAQNIFTMMK